MKSTCMTNVRLVQIIGEGFGWREMDRREMDRRIWRF